MGKPISQIFGEASVDSAAQLIRVCGELDSSNAKTLRGPLQSAVDAGAQVVLLDLSECPFVDSTGLAAILNGARELKLAGVALVAVTANSDIVKHVRAHRDRGDGATLPHSGPRPCRAGRGARQQLGIWTLVTFRRV